MKIEYLKNLNLPDAPGVYFFYKDNNISYIGRATSLKDRVRSYFSNDLIKTRGPLIIDMVTSADRLTWQETDSLLEAIILEAELIKKHQPLANTKDKDNRSFNYVIITDEEFPRVLLERGRNVEKDAEKNTAKKKSGDTQRKIKNYFGPYPSSQLLRDSMKIIRKIFPYRDYCEPGSARPCFNYQIGLCPGVCIGAINRSDYAKRIKLICLFLEGKKPVVIKELTKSMNEHASKMEFEKANEIKGTLTALSHIQDVALIKDDRLNNIGRTSDELIFDEKTNASFDPTRIEAYDVAHISGKYIVGVMVVLSGLGSSNSEFDKRAYRKFKIRTTDTANDAKSLSEILTRRLRHIEWPLPAYMVVDGNQIQINAANQALELSDAAKNFGVKVVSIVKDQRHKARAILGIDSSDLKIDQTNQTNKAVIEQMQKDFIKVNAEAHRFALAYHRLARSREMFDLISRNSRNKSKNTNRGGGKKGKLTFKKPDIK